MNGKRDGGWEEGRRAGRKKVGRMGEWRKI